MNQVIPEIAITWKPTSPKSKTWFNIPLNTKRTVELTVQARIGKDYQVVIKKPLSPWLKLSRLAGSVPFQTIVTVDTTGLGRGAGYKETLEFEINGVTVYKEPIYLTTQIYDTNEQQIALQTYALLDAGKPKKNFLISLLTAISTTYHIGFSIVFIIVFLFALLLVLAIIGAVITR